MKLKASPIFSQPDTGSTPTGKGTHGAQRSQFAWFMSVFGMAALLAAVVVASRISLLLAAAVLTATLFTGALICRWPSVRRLLRPRLAVLGDAKLAERAVARLDRTGKVMVVRAAHASEAIETRAAEADLIRLVKQGSVDQVAIILPPDDKADGLAAIVGRLRDLSVDVSMYRGDSVGDPNLPRALVPSLFVPGPLYGWRLVVKDIEDSVIAALLLIALAPLMALISLAVLVTSPGPVLFTQTRHGFRGQDVKVYKFRTMRVDVADYSGRNQTRRNDPRITRVGRFLRATSLDELPQLFNVIRGEMSIVGPRPHPLDMRTNGLLCQDIVEDYHRRHRVRPGITGWAQINGYRGATTTREHVEGRVRLDNYYIDNWSLLFDLRIMLLTGAKVFADENAF